MNRDDHNPERNPSPVRWVIAALLFFAAVLNYVDKNTLSLLAPTIQKDLGITDQGYAQIQNAFQVAYTIALLASGGAARHLPHAPRTRRHARSP